MSFQESFDQPAGQIVEVIGIGRRLVAYLIDGIILGVVQFIIFFCMGFAIGAASAEGEISSQVDLVSNCLGLLISAAYFIGFWATYEGQTPGKMVMGIKVVGVDGAPVSGRKAALRFVGYIVSGLILYIGFIWAAFDAKRQGWHDKIASTYVVSKETNFAATDNPTVVPADEGSSTPIIIVVVGVVGLILIPIVVCAILLVLGPVVGNVFSNIVEELQTPTP